MEYPVDRKIEYLFFILSIIFFSADLILIILADKMIALLGSTSVYRVICSLCITLTIACSIKWFFLWVMNTTGTR